MRVKPGIDCIGVGVGALIINHQGKFLITLRGLKAKNESGKWEIPGGGVEFGETMVNAIVREMKEEHGIEIKVKALLHVADHIIPDEKQHWISPTFICEIAKGEPVIKEPLKCAEIRWVSLVEAERLPLSIVTQKDIEYLKKNKHLISKLFRS